MDWCIYDGVLSDVEISKLKKKKQMRSFLFLYPLYIYFCGLQSKYVNGLSDRNWEKEGAWDSEWVSERERGKGKFKNWFIGFTQTFSLTLLFVDWI